MLVAVVTLKFSSVLCPIAVLEKAPVLALKADLPTAVLAPPVVKASPARPPIRVLASPVVTDVPA